MNPFDPRVIALGWTGLVYLRSVDSGVVSEQSLDGYFAGLRVSPRKQQAAVKMLEKHGVWVRVDGGWEVVTDECEPEQVASTESDTQDDLSPAERKRLRDREWRRLKRLEQRQMSSLVDDDKRRHVVNDTKTTSDDTERQGVGGSSLPVPEVSIPSNTESLKTKDNTNTEDSEAQRQSAQKPSDSQGIVVTESKRNARKPRAKIDQSVIEVVPFPSQLDTESVRSAVAKWSQFRREMRKPLTPTGVETMLASYATRPDALIAAINFTIGKGWQGLQDPPAERTLFKDPSDPRGTMALRERLLAQEDDWT